MIFSLREREINPQKNSGIQLGFDLVEYYTSRISVDLFFGLSAKISLLMSAYCRLQ